MDISVTGGSHHKASHSISELIRTAKKETSRLSSNLQNMVGPVLPANSSDSPYTKNILRFNCAVRPLLGCCFLRRVDIE